MTTRPAFSPLASRVLAVAFLLGSLALAGCDGADTDDDMPPPPVPTPGIEMWAGSYTGQSRFGGTGGTWGNGGTYPLVVAASGQVTVSGSPLVSPTYNASTSVLSWSLSDGNATNGSVTFRSSFTSGTFFADFANNTAGQSFTGTIQLPGQGALEYRGVLR